MLVGELEILRVESRDAMYISWYDDKLVGVCRCKSSKCCLVLVGKDSRWRFEQQNLNLIV